MRKKRYYGWTITAALAVTETISWGILYYAFSVFITSMEADLKSSRTEITGAFSLAMLVMGAMAFPVGAWIDRHGARLLMTAGSIAASVLVLAWSQVNSLPALYLIWIGLGVCCAAVLYEPAFVVIAAWFVRYRSRALAVVTFAAGLASTIFVPLSDALLHGVGWRNAVLILGILLAVITIPLHALFLRRRPADLGLMPDGEESNLSAQPVKVVTLGNALNSKSFWILTAAFSLSYLAAIAIRFHFIPLLVYFGIDPSTAAIASGSIGLMQVAGRVVFAPLDSRFSSHTMVVGVFALQAAAVSVLFFGGSILAIGIFILVFGAAYGATTLARPAILADLYGSSHLGRISSVMAIFLTIAATVAPVGAGWLYDTSGSYQPVIALGFVILLMTVGVMFLIKPEREVVQGELHHAAD